MPKFEPRQILIVHEQVWRALEQWAGQRNLIAVRLPDGSDDDGTLYFQEDRPGTECAECGHTPTYGFMPREI
jgi:hypothetical protein